MAGSVASEQTPGWSGPDARGCWSLALGEPRALQFTGWCAVVGLRGVQAFGPGLPSAGQFLDQGLLESLSQWGAPVLVDRLEAQPVAVPESDLAPLDADVLAALVRPGPPGCATVAPRALARFARVGGWLER